MPNIGNYHQRIISGDVFIGKTESANEKFAVRKSYDIIKKMNDIRNTLLFPFATAKRSEIYNKNFDNLCHFIKARLDIENKISINLSEIEKSIDLNKPRDFNLESPARMIETLLYEIEGKANYLIELRNNGFLLLNNNEINFAKAMHTFSYLYHQLDQDKQAILQKQIADKVFLGMNFNVRQSDLLVMVLTNMVTPESILYSNSLSKAADNFIQLKKDSFYYSLLHFPLHSFIRQEKNIIIEHCIEPLAEFYFQVDNKKKIIEDVIDIVINRENKFLTTHQQQDIYCTIESYFNSYQAYFSSLEHNNSLNIFNNDWCQKSYSKHLLKEENLLSLTVASRVIYNVRNAFAN
ncbi:hypothetical protein QE197_18920 [Arsenophonus nasoniae]|uniref:Uncharacterized protein n=1 Tax=Arsenophonus nasoniae TaxID=638 RepID=D2U3E6_9GAMM|nr:hypothetical protein [Arsenophonus nasoniae]QBY41536.1 hypothetical protein ArsFIN_00540 [Arsenophonus nasoniae]WGM01487.1 hypothetical protein QE210_17070 [Arsenophonus nasoniae]WGM05750.1 hypothetical protein QE258_20295 [Arsenophonus nasoniae]WGM10761.1 hypothetical protein QE197_18920 [Arsenophonus nasoniae]WGM15468.1 hypothetical protein QE193_18810 [Arsenophonus nasoniae]